MNEQTKHTCNDGFSATACAVCEKERNSPRGTTTPHPLRELDLATIIVARRMLTVLKGVTLERADMATSALLAAIRTQPVAVEGDTVSIRVMDEMLRAMEPAA